MDIIGSGSAATLGYILDNTRGAKRATALYRNFRNMPPTPKKSNYGRHRFNPYVTPQSNRSRQTINPFARGRSMSLSSRRSSKSSASRRVGNASRGPKPGTASIMSVAVRKRGNAVHKEGVKKKVKVSRLFRKKVKACESAAACHGRFTDTQYFQVIPNDNAQSNLELGIQTQNTLGFFTPVYVLQAASVLFNNAALATNPNVLSPGFFNAKAFKVEVVKQFATFRFRNNTARDLTVNIYAVSPKGKQYSDGWNALSRWQDDMALDTQTATGFAGGAVNLSNATPATMWTSPGTTAKFKNNYAVDTTKIVLEPGKEYVYSLTGPQPKVYDFQKYYSNPPGAPVFENQQKFIKQVIVSCYANVTGTSVGIVGRNTDMASPGAYGLLIEQVIHTRIKVPEQAGFQLPTAAVAGSSTIPLSQRKDAYYFVNRATAPGVSTIGEIEDENPQAAATVGI